ncbi:SDR family oxidoreductase [Streptomyces sp. NPDC001890]|uniref:SDR family oxidoreductase n=1 Tax=Streptomyces sp. NPDC001890 TaxID=3364620 RepID=UPI00369C06C2
MHFFKVVSKAVGGRGIRVNTVSSCLVKIGLRSAVEGIAATVSQATGMAPEEVTAQAAGMAVTGRFSKPAEVADAVLVLASDRTSKVAGSDVTIDGGFVTTWQSHRGHAAEPMRRLPASSPPWIDKENGLATRVLRRERLVGRSHLGN